MPAGPADRLCCLEIMLSLSSVLLRNHFTCLIERKIDRQSLLMSVGELTKLIESVEQSNERNRVLVRRRLFENCTIILNISLIAYESEN